MCAISSCSSGFVSFIFRLIQEPWQYPRKLFPLLESQFPPNMKVLYTLTSSYKSFLSSGKFIIPFPLKHTSLAKVSPVLPYQVKFSSYGPTLVPFFCFSQLFITVVILCLFVGISDQRPTLPLDYKPLKGRDNLSFSPSQPTHSTMPKRDR